ncbi:MAG: T9SS type A sorting domain-containing protein [bacterium]|nr:T9SS type A sorting domain-containing protein [bacterium]
MSVQRNLRDLLTVLIACVLQLAAPLSTTAEEASSKRTDLLIERPEDPPGRPALPVPGAPPARKIRFGTATSIQVNIDAVGANIPGDAANEPSIAVDPTNPNTMAIGWRQFDTITSNFRQAGYAHSTDGGRTWTFPGVLEPTVFRSDPVLSFDVAGNFYYNSLKVVGGTFDSWVFKSSDGGVSWGVPVFAFGGDKVWMTIDRTAGTSAGHIYQAWSTAANQFAPNTFNRSVNGGTSFTAPSLLTNQPIWGTLDVAPDGTLYVVGIDDNNFTLFWLATSTDAKNPVGTPTFTTTSFPINGIVQVGTGPNPAGLLGQTWITVDPSTGPNAGNIYVVASVNPTGADPADIQFTRSTDGGATWSPPVTLNDDGTLRWQWFGTMSVSQSGRIDVIWNDQRNSALINESELFYTSSSDGGVTWTPNQQLSPMWNSFVGWPNQNKIGDYYHMISDDVGAHLAWAATFNGEQDVYYLRIGDYDCNDNGVGDAVDIATNTSYDFNGNGIPDECEPGATGIGDLESLPYRLYQNTPNPFNPTTVIQYDMPPAGGAVKLEVFDVFGRLVNTLVDGFVDGGPQFANWDGRDARGATVASGVYFYRLRASGFSETRKMVLLK